MTKERLHNLFDKAKEIKPSEGFLSRTRARLYEEPLDHPRSQFFFESLHFGATQAGIYATAACAAAFIIYMSSSISVNEKQSVAMKRTEQIEDYKIDVTLKDARYYKEVAPNVFVVVSK